MKTAQRAGKFKKIVFLLLFSCFLKKPTVTEYAFQNKNCTQLLQEKLTSSGCESLSYRVISNYDLIIKCNKTEEFEYNYWNSNEFRISSTILEYINEESILVEKRTICKDTDIRIENYSYK